MSDFWTKVGQAFLSEMMNQMAEAMLKDMDPDQARVFRLLLRLRAAVGRLDSSSQQAALLMQQLALFLAGDKAGLAQGLQAAVQSVLVARDVFDGFQEVQEVIDDIRAEWDRYRARNMLTYR